MSAYHNVNIPPSLMTTTGNLNAAVIRRQTFKESEFCKDIISKTCFLGETSSFTERLYCVEHNITSHKKCSCGALVSFNKNKKEYNKLCRACGSKTYKNNKKISETKQSKNKSIRELFWIKWSHYLGAPVNGLSELYDKVEACKPNQHAVGVREMETRADLLCHVLKLTEDLIPVEKDKYRWHERIYCLKNEVTFLPKCKICNTCNTTFISFKEGYRKCCSNPKCVSVYAGSCRAKEHFRASLETIKTQGFEILTDPDAFTGINNERVFLVHTSCGKSFDADLSNGRLNKITCPHCVLPSTSADESELYEFVQALGVDLLHRCKIIPPKEVDIYIPSKKLAIEYDGVYWHSSAHKPKNYHRQKTEECSNAGIQLIHVFSTEWMSKKEIVKSIIKSKLGMYDKRIFARKTSIKQVGVSDRNRFLESNHLQGSCNGSVCLGLYFGDELVSVALFGRRKITRGSINWELLRFCSCVNTQVIGGFSKLLSKFISDYLSIGETLITYADKRYSDGTFYTSCGFTLDHMSPPSYWYVKNNSDKMQHRSLFQKHLLHKKLQTFDKSKTEYENMAAAGYMRVYDCGQFVFQITRQK